MTRAAALPTPVLGMAAHCDVSLADRTGTADLAEMAASCATCPRHDPCIVWLAEHSGLRGPAAGFCPNAAIFRSLSGSDI